ncbi:MAG TPA: mannose-1-phosphate guanylyltransferase/mannose-6-phosphate isomerase [bacterium]|nr:mannose-1-phosphate guanylyltransferase/mannose-6-phosphate isomerase [bacterium]HOL46564.1 mannose-1-phosphate guanylyltransferase/mannose-6-phosphate isomerase [bacterium]HPQ17865.1 mannose-1-phosphate guanylyltransferase/mannose-6-phosphate isomerase [bacterium]
MKIIILAGGSGTRLWPLSREYYPKYLLSLFNNETLFQSTIKRFLPVSNDFIIVTNKNINEDIFINQLSVFKNINYKIIQEPLARNTAPAIALAMLTSDNDDLFLVSPSDHIILNNNEFTEIIKSAINAAKNNYIITFGIKPTYPDTNFGYIKSSSAAYEKNIYFVEGFFEKPDFETAKKYFNDSNFFWNCGIFLFNKNTMINELNKFCPDVLNGINNYINSNFKEDEYSKLLNISIDYAVMEKTKNILISKAENIGWSDIGNWKAYFDIQQKDNNNNYFEGDIINFNSSNNFVFSKEKLTAIVGINNLAIVDTKDALLVCNIEQTQYVKNIFEKLKEQDREEYKLHALVQKPWGYYYVIEKGVNYLIKRICVHPNHKLSLQSHNFRDEHWVVIKGNPIVIKDNNKYTLKENEYIFIPKKIKHRLINNTKKNIEIIEIQFGEKLDEYDIIRYEDDYKRK